MLDVVTRDFEHIDIFRILEFRLGDFACAGTEEIHYLVRDEPAIQWTGHDFFEFVAYIAGLLKQFTSRKRFLAFARRSGSPAAHSMTYFLSGTRKILMRITS